MSDQRYSLAATGRRGAGENRGGLSLLVRDDWSGEERDPATLSGGETFVVSLALALGLADVITQESDSGAAGDSRLDTLFVDEGFGSLDADTLDDVMDTLDSLREGGRVVGVVSHVAEMRDRIPCRLEVTKSRRGSRVRGSGRPAKFDRMTGLDPTFSALPYRALGDAALARAAALGRHPRRLPLRADPLPAPRRPRRRAPGRRRHRGPRLRGARHPRRRVGLRLRRGAHRRRGRAVGRDRRRGRQGGRRDDRHPRRARRRAGARRRDLGVAVPRQPARGAHRREGGPADRRGPTGCASTASSSTPPPASSRSRRTSTTPTSPAPGPPSSGSACSRSSRRWAPTPAPAPSTRCAPSLPRRPTAGSTSPTASGTGTPSCWRPPTCSPRSSRPPPSRPASTTWWSTRPTCGSPSTSRSGTPPSSTGCSATRPTTPARRSRPTTSSAACATARS